MHKPLTCFLIDDDEDDREIFSLALNDVSAEVRCVLAFDGMDALEKLRRSESLPDFIFLDLNMPRMDGKECISGLKKESRLFKLPVVIYSTSSHSRDQSDATRLGAAHFFTKPPSIAA